MLGNGRRKRERGWGSGPYLSSVRNVGTVRRRLYSKRMTDDTRAAATRGGPCSVSLNMEMM